MKSMYTHVASFGLGIHITFSLFSRWHELVFWLQCFKFRFHISCGACMSWFFIFGAATNFGYRLGRNVRVSLFIGHGVIV